MDFPNNSQAARNIQPEKPETPEPERLKKVVTGNVRRRKKPLGTRIKDMFITDGSNFGEMLVKEIILPMAKQTLMNCIQQSALGFQQGVEKQLFGEVRTHTAPRLGGINGFTNYGSQYAKYSGSGTVVPINRRPGPTPQSSLRRPRQSNVIEDIVVDTRHEAELIIDELNAKIDTEGYCSVGDLYSLTGIPTNAVDEVWGWTDLLGARARTIAADQYLIDMPRPRSLEI